MVGGGVEMCDTAVLGVGDFGRFDVRAWVEGGGVMLLEEVGCLPEGRTACDVSGVTGAAMCVVE